MTDLQNIQIEQILDQGEIQKRKKQIWGVSFPTIQYVFGMISTESQWNINQESYIQRGLMQMTKVALDTVNGFYKTKFTFEDMYDPYKQVLSGSLYLTWIYYFFTLKNIIPTEPIITLGYSWGIGNTYRWLKNTEQTNNKIDEAVPAEKIQHLLDNIWWKNYWDNEIELLEDE